MTHLLVIANNAQPSWIRYIKNRIANNRNFIGFVGGPTGSGKSWSCITIATFLDPNFSIDNIVFDAKGLMARVNRGKLKPGSVIVFEEAGVALSNRNWQSTLNKIINYLFQTFRHKRFILLMNSPYMDFIDAATRKLFHAELKTIKIDKARGVTILKPQIIQYNDRKDKFYYKYLRSTTETGGLKVIKHWAVPRPPTELVEAYELKKSAYTEALNADIEAQLLNDSHKEEKREFHCNNCGHEWKPKGKNPSCCPKCRKNDVIEVKTLENDGVSEREPAAT